MEKITITIDGKEVEAIKDQPVLMVARENGIDIPALCHHPELESSGGSCRVCLVEAVQGGRSRIVTSCNYPVRKGLVVNTSTEQVMKIRKGVRELLLCRVPDSEVVQKLAAKYRAGRASRDQMVAQRNAVQARLSKNQEVEQTLRKEHDIKAAVVAEEKGQRGADDPFVKSLETQVRDLQTNIDAMHKGSTQLAGIDERLSI